MSLPVLHLIGGGEMGGAERHVQNLLLNFDRQRITPFLGCLVSPSPLALKIRSEEIEAEIFPMRFPLDPGPIKSLLRYCRNKGIKLIHCHGLRANFLGRITARLLGLPSISTIHSLPETDYLSPWKGRIAKIVDRSTLPLASGLITVSNSIKEHVLKNLNQRPIPLRTIYNGIEELDFSKKETMRLEFRQKWGIDPEAKVLGTIGRLHPVKGQIYLIEAAKHLSIEFPNLHLLLIGSGPLKNQVEDLLLKYNLSYTLTGFLPDAWRALPAMDVFSLPSLNEGMGLVLLEAAQAEIPIVASRVGGIPELFTADEEALLCRPADSLSLALACSALLKNQDLGNRLADKASKRSRLFKIDKMIQETSAFYSEIVGEQCSF
ncbi:MAG: glycosyltransferase family 4 protein [Desulfitobacteriia bacterium]|jgi:glycosyltransferase involved in cell wall biosynthesis